jgi:DNA-binding NtrC family response regulator
MDGLRKLEAGIYDLILLDLMMPDRSGLDLLGDIRARDIETPVFLITAYGSIDVAVQALKAAPNDYFSKPWDNEKLVLEIDRQIAGARLERENRELRRALKQRYAFPNIVGKSERMQRMLDLVSQVAPAEVEHPDHRRDRHRQGADRQGHPRQLAARRPDPSSESTPARCRPICWRARCSAT